MTESIDVAFDHTIFASQVFGGISRYIVAMSAELPAFGIRPRIIAPLHVNNYLAAAPHWQHCGLRLGSGRIAGRIARVIDRPIQRPLAALSCAQIVHESYYTENRLAPRKAKVAIMVHDMIHELRPQDFVDDPLPRIKAASIARADHIFCNSESTRRDLIALYPDTVSRSSVTLLGFANGVARALDGAPGRPYILYVGYRHAYKNFGSLLTAYAELPGVSREFDLRCIGGGPFSPDERARIKALGISDRVFHESVDDETLCLRYRRAALFVYPSLYEGFGIPPLEAMANSCPVVTTNISSMPEICGDAAEYAELGDAGSLASAIGRVLWDSGRAAELRHLGDQRHRLFSWRRCAEETAKGYCQIL